jgi:hypothetical protein
MTNRSMIDRAALEDLLAQALELADRLDLTMAAIHIDEARALLAEQNVAAA